MSSGAITRKQIIEDDAIRWGEEYVKSLSPAIEKNKEFVQTILALNEANQKLRGSSNSKEFNENLKTSNELGEKAITIWKEQIQLENNLISTKKKNELATESTNKALIKERTILSETNLEIKRQAIANGLLESSYKKLSAQVLLAGNKIKDMIATGKLASESQEQYNKRLSVAQREFDKLNARVRAADAAVGQFNRNVGNYPQAAFDGIKKLVEAFGVVTGIQLFVSVMKDAFTTVRGFEKEIVNLAAIAGKSRDEIAPLEAKIREVAKSSINGATDVAKLATELIKLGSTTEEAEKLLEPVNNLSVALQASAEDSATLVKSILNSYGEGAGEAARVTDILAESANRSALDFQGLRDSFSYLAPSSRALGISIEKTAAIIGTLADNGIKAESAGRLTSTAFARLANQGLTLEDALNKINKAQQDGSSQLEVLALASNLFGAEAGKIGLILANNTEKINDSTKAYENSEGALKSLTDKQLKSLDSELKILSSAWEDYVLDTNEASGASSALSGGIRFLSGNLSTILSILGYVTLAWVGYRAALLLANAQTKLLALTTTTATVATAEQTVVTGFQTTAQVANATATTVATSAWERFNTALKANALMLIISALAAAIYALDKFNESVETTAARTKESSENFLKNREQLTKTAASTKQLSDRYAELQDKAKKLGGETKLTADEQKEMQRIVSELAKVVPGAVSAVNKYGEALKLNQKLLAEYNKENAKVLEIDKKKAINDEIKLQKELAESISDRTKNLKNYKKVEGQGSITTEFVVQKERELSVLKTEAILSKGRLKDLQGLTQAEKEAAKASDEKTNTQVANGARTIDVIDAEIKAQEELVKGLSDKTGKEGRSIKAKIAALTAEREQIYSTAKAEKEKQDNGLKNAKKTNDALYQLSQFRYQNEINNNQKIIDSEKSTNEERINALLEIQQLQESKNNETLSNDLLKFALEKDGLDKLSKDKLAIYQRDAKARVDSIIAGKVATEKLTSEEQLIYEKYQNALTEANKKGIEDRQKLVDSQAGIIQKDIDSRLQSSDTELNNRIAKENKLYLGAVNAAKDNFELIEQLKLSHEQKIFKITQEYAKKNLQVQIDTMQKLLDDNKKLPVEQQLSAEKRAEIENKLSNYRKQLSEVNIETVTKENELTWEKKQEYAKRAEALEKEQKERTIQLAQDLASSLIDLTNSIFDARIQAIDDEKEYWNSYYDEQIDLAGNDARQKDLLEKEKAKKAKELEKERKKELVKAEIFNRAVKLAEIGMNLAVTISEINKAAAAMDFYAAFGFGAAGATYRAIQIPLAIGTAAIQTGTVLATPLPKYKTGRKDGPEEYAFVGDGYRREVISNPDGSNPIITPAKPTVVKLEQHKMVHSSIDEYHKYLNTQILNDIYKEKGNLRNYQELIMQDDFYSKEILAEMKRNTQAIIRNKPKYSKSNNDIDLNYQLFRMSNIKWSR